jgi:hypothetical protein
MTVGSESGDPDMQQHVAIAVLDINSPKAGVSAAFMQS